jgi:L-ascorbate metabolism protein UlaG (beta-lactamase superfamily)
MKIRFLGHASFLITSDAGVNIITDPYKPGCFDGGIQYGKITEAADIVTISHEHDDHSETDIAGTPTFVRDAKPQQIKGIEIMGVDTFHDTGKGSERGSNVIYKMVIDGMDVVHLGDLGHELSKEEVDKIGNVDVLLVPVGGYFTVDAKVADSIMDLLKPKVVIPMHRQ